jgi:hypothetical protein
MSAVDDAYRRLIESERKMWMRAASIAQDERRSPIEVALALDVTALLVKIGHGRAVLLAESPPAVALDDQHEAAETTSKEAQA